MERWSLDGGRIRFYLGMLPGVLLCPFAFGELGSQSRGVSTKICSFNAKLLLEVKKREQILITFLKTSRNHSEPQPVRVIVLSEGAHSELLFIWIMYLPPLQSPACDR